MQLDFAFLADFAQTSGGKINVVGGAFDHIWTKDVPLTYPLMTLVARLVLSPAEVGRDHKLEVIIMDSDGKKIANVDGGLRVERSIQGDAWKPSGTFLALNFLGVRFEKFGSYSIEIVANGSSLKSIPLEIAKRAEQPLATR